MTTCPPSPRQQTEYSGILLSANKEESCKKFKSVSVADKKSEKSDFQKRHLVMMKRVWQNILEGTWSQEELEDQCPNFCFKSW